MARKEVVGFNKADANALLGLIGGSGTVINSIPQQLTNDATRLVIGFTVGGATGRSGTTAGSGTASVYYLDGATLTDAGYDVDYLNLAVDPVGTNKYILLLRLGAQFLCVWEECA